MGSLRKIAVLPREVISLTTYAQLDLYLAKFSAGELGLVLLLGRHGTGKSEGVRLRTTCLTGTKIANKLGISASAICRGTHAAFWTVSALMVIPEYASRTG